jgi:uncharacterized protein
MMTDALIRIANALDRLCPSPADHAPQGKPAYHWEGGTLQAVPHFAPVELDLLTGIDAQKQALLTNGRRLAKGHAAHDVLLWGARGSGKSALVKSSVARLQADGEPLCLIEISSSDLASLGGLFDLLATRSTPAICFIDDLAFDGPDDAARQLRSVLEGGARARPPHVRLYVTSNRRHIVERSMAEQADPINPRDVADDRLALADRFGLSLGFHVCTQDEYLAMVAGYAAHLGVVFDRQDALTWSTQRGSRSGRVAWHYAVELAGRAGKNLTASPTSHP